MRVSKDRPVGYGDGHCHHIFALLMVLESYGPCWEHHVAEPEGEVITSKLGVSVHAKETPQAGVQTDIERSKFNSKRKVKEHFVSYNNYQDARAYSIHVP